MLAVYAHYAARERSLAEAALGGASAFVRWTHYPRNDVQDAANGARFFYHAHEPHEMRPNEHGHFHVFTAWGQSREPRYAHLVGISIDNRGTPLRLFTTNEWVTGEDWVQAAQLQGKLDRFRIQTSGRWAPVAKWLSGMVRFYASSIVSLLHSRDACVQAHAQHHGQHLDEARADRSLHIVSEMDLSDHWKFLKEERVR